MLSSSVNYKCVLQDLKARRDRLNAAIEAVEQIMGEVKGGMEVTTQSPVIVQSSNDNGSGRFRKMTLKDAAISLIAESGNSKTTVEIVNGLKDGGVNSESKNLYTTVYNTLTGELSKEKGKIVRNQDKSWSLKNPQQ